MRLEVINMIRDQKCYVLCGSSNFVVLNIYT